MTNNISINKPALRSYLCYKDAYENINTTVKVCSTNNSLIATYIHSTYGSIMPGRYFSSATGYRYGFNGKENDNEVSGIGNKVDFGARVYDNRLGRFLSIDPKSREFTSFSHYSYAYNNPIIFIDKEGEDGHLVVEQASKTINLSTTIFVYGENMTQSFVDNMQKQFNTLDNSAKVIDPDTKEEWTISINITFKFVNESTAKLLDNELSNKTNIDDDNAPGSIDTRKISSEIKNTLGYKNGDNILKYDGSDLKQRAEYGEVQHTGSNYGSLFAITPGIAIHEVFHQLGYDERYCNGFSYPEFRGDVLDTGSDCAEYIHQVHFYNLYKFAIRQSDCQSIDTDYHYNPTQDCYDNTSNGCNIDNNNTIEAKECVIK